MSIGAQKTRCLQPAGLSLWTVFDMTSPINLNQARKAKQKAAREQQAAENRIKFGQTKAEKIRQKAEKSQHTTALDGHKRDGPDPK